MAHLLSAKEHVPVQQQLVVVQVLHQGSIHQLESLQYTWQLADGVHMHSFLCASRAA